MSAGERRQWKPNTAVIAGTPVDAKNPLVNYEIEQAFLGALICNNAVYDQVYQYLKPEHFADALHSRIYEAIGQQIAQGRRADVLTLKHTFEQDPALSEVGGKYLVDLAQAVVTVLNADDYAIAIRELYLRRQMVQIANEMAQRATDVRYLAQKPADLATEFESRLFDITQSTMAETNLPVPARLYIEESIQQLEAAYKRSDVVNGIKTGLVGIDEKIGALMRGKQYILAGRPSMGKSSLAICIAEQAARADHKVLFFSPEMPRTEIGIRQIAMEANISGFEAMRGTIQDDVIMSRVMAMRHNLSGLPVWVDETAAITIAELCMKARQHHRKHGLDLIVIDYLQLVHPTRMTDNRANDVASMSRATKELAKQLDVAVLVLSQLSRQVESREDKRPQLSDLRESGAIEQDADVVMFLFRQYYYLARAEPKDDSKRADWLARCNAVRHVAEVIVAKHRGGPVGTGELRFDEVTTRFYDKPEEVATATMNERADLI